MIKDWRRYPNFHSRELASPDQPGSGDMMDVHTMDRVQALRTILDRAIRINSGYRTPAHNRAVSGGTRSAHLRGRAVDIYWLGWSQAEKDDLVRVARQLGFTGCGIGRSFVHLDDVGNQEGYHRPLMWDYLAGGKAGNYRPWAAVPA